MRCRARALGGHRAGRMGRGREAHPTCATPAGPGPLRRPGCMAWTCASSVDLGFWMHVSVWTSTYVVLDRFVKCVYILGLILKHMVLKRMNRKKLVLPPTTITCPNTDVSRY
jgi:hypothetical protein